MIKDLKIALVLAGGTSHGVHQAGFLKALLEHVPLEYFKVVSASSIGCFNGYGVFTGKLEKVEELWKSIDGGSIFNLYQMANKQGFINRFIDEICSENDNLAPAFYATTVYLSKGTINYWKMQGEFNKDWKIRLAQAVSFPFLVKRTNHNGEKHVDGGLFDNTPVYPLQYENDVDLTLILHVDPKYRPDFSLFKKSKIVLDIMVDANDFSATSHFNFKKEFLNKGFESGYNYGIDICSRLFSNSTDIETMLKNSQQIYCEELKKRNRAAMPTIVTKINNLFLNQNE